MELDLIIVFDLIILLLLFFFIFYYCVNICGGNKRSKNNMGWRYITHSCSLIFGIVPFLHGTWNVTLWSLSWRRSLINGPYEKKKYSNQVLILYLLINVNLGRFWLHSFTFSILGKHDNNKSIESKTGVTMTRISMIISIPSLQNK